MYNECVTEIQFYEKENTTKSFLVEYYEFFQYMIKDLRHSNTFCCTNKKNFQLLF